MLMKKRSTGPEKNRWGLNSLSCFHAHEKEISGPNSPSRFKAREKKTHPGLFFNLRLRKASKPLRERV